MQFMGKTYSRTAILALVGLIIYCIAVGFGDLISGLGANGECSKYFGCITGFFGYDAVEHFVTGLASVWILVWLCRRFPKYSILQSEKFKSVLFILSFIMLCAVIWEFVECAHDIVRQSVFHEVLFNRRLHIDLLDQPTNLDTMGDLSFNMLGSIIALFFADL